MAVKPLCDQLRLLFFGNFRQDWSEFVLTDLGIFKYEQVARDPATRAFQTRQHIDTFHALFVCRQQLDESEDLAAVLDAASRAGCRQRLAGGPAAQAAVSNRATIRAAG